MEKRKWLWKRRSFEKSMSDAESLNSMSSHSERCSDDQDCSRASSTHNPQSLEVTSKTAYSDLLGSSASTEHLRQEMSDVSSGSPNHLPELAEDILNARDTDIINECNGTSERLNNDLSFTGDSPKDKVVIKDGMSDGYVKLETKLDEVHSGSSDDGKEDNETVKLLTEKLSAALLNVSQKDELVKQHSKVAEEAVAGWEKAENEVVALKQQLEATVQQKSTLEARVSHLDEALKECVRQLRLSRDEQERKIKEAVAEKTQEWELVKSKLEGHIVQLQAQAESSTNSSDSELHYKLEYLETENAALKQELLLQSEELEIRTIERDLNSKAAETASKQHLESIKKVTKLQAESRRLKAFPRIVSCKNDKKSLANGQLENSDLLNSETDSQINGSAVNRNMTSSSIEIDLMDDFLEMERLAAMSESVAKPTFESENKIRNELQLMIDRTAELEEKVKILEEEKDELERVFAQTNYCFEESQVQLIEAQMKLEPLEQKLQEINELRQYLESQTLISNGEAHTMSSEIASLTEEIEKERALSSELSSKCRELRDELQRMKHVVEEVKCGPPSIEELKLKDKALAESQNSLRKSESRLQETEGKLKLIKTQLTEAHQSKESLELELCSARAEVQAVLAHIDSLQAQIEKGQALSAELSTKCRELESELECKTRQLDQQISQPKIEVKIKQEDLALAAGKLAECQRTIVSLGNQLNSLATLEDFLIDTANIPGFSPVGAAQISSSGRDEPWQLHSNGTYMDSQGESFLPVMNYIGSEFLTHSSSLSDFLLSCSTRERSRNGFRRFS